MQQSSQERQGRIARDEEITEEELAYACLIRAGEERKIRLARYAAMNEARLNDAHLNRAGE